jgi:thiol-disulfide isomerase/thioredoxin
MLRFVALLACGSAAAFGQSRVDLLQRVVDRYDKADSFVVKGTASATIPGTSWRATYEFETEGSQPDFLPVTFRSPSMRTITHVAHLVETRVTEGAIDPKPNQGIGLVPFGRYGELTRRLVDARKVGEETIAVEGRSYSCELIDATYDYSPQFKPNSQIVHSHLAIDPVNLLVFRETRSTPDVGEWTAEVKSFSFDQPPSEEMLKARRSMASQPKSRPEWIGRSAPELTLNQLSGAPISLVALRGKFVLLDFWASYCGPCRHVTQHAQELVGRYPSLTVLTLTRDSQEDAKRWTQFYHVDLPVLLDPDGTAFKAFDIEGVPAAILVDKDGKVVHYWLGLDDLSSMDSDMAAAIQVRAAGLK